MSFPLAGTIGWLLFATSAGLAQIAPVTPTPPPIIDPTPTIPPRPTVAPVETPTVPPATPPPVFTPTIPPPPPTPTIRPFATPTIPPLRAPSVNSANPQFASVTVQYGQTGSLQLKNSRGRFQPVALQPTESVIVIMTFTTADFGKPANIQVLDGGAISTLPVTVANPNDIPSLIPTPPPPTPIQSTVTATLPPPDPCNAINCNLLRDPNRLTDTGQTVPVSLVGQLLFGFRPGDGPGMHRVSVIVGGNQYVLQFWQQDPAAANNNPGLLRAY